MRIVFMKLRIAFYALLAAIGSFVFEVSFLIFVMPIMLAFVRQIDKCFRIKTWIFGRFMTGLFFPMIRVQVKGKEHLSIETSSIVVCNHRSFVDVFLANFCTVPDTVVCARRWPFKMFVLSWNMKLAKYINIEDTPINEVLDKTKEHKERGASFLLYPEGHRSKDGKLQRFQSGAFHIAIHNNLPVIPVIMTGSEQFKDSIPFIRRATVNIEILPPVYPDLVEYKQPAVILKRNVEAIYRNVIN